MGLGGLADSIGGFFNSIFGSGDTAVEVAPVKKAFGGIVSRRTNITAGEAGPEAIIPLQGGQVPVQLSGETAAASVKALVSVGESMDEVNTSISGGNARRAEQLTGIEEAINTQTTQLSANNDMNTDRLLSELQTLQAQLLANMVASIGLGGGSSILGDVLGLVGGAVGGLAGGSDSGFGSGSGFTADVGSLSAGGSNSGFGNDISDFGGSFGNDIQFDSVDIQFAKGGIADLVRGYAQGGIVERPEIALIGEGRKSEAIVPLPDNKSIPVVFQDDAGNSQGDKVGNIYVTVNVTGVRDEGSLNKSANQIALETARISERALRRNG